MDRHHEIRQRPSLSPSMKSIVMGAIIVLISGLLISAPGLAGGKGKHHGHDPERKLQKLTKRLGLSDEQQGKVKAILEEKHHKLQELHQQMKEIRKNAREQIKAQLTPEQVEKFKKQRGKRKHRKNKGMHGKKHGKAHQEENEESDEYEDEKDDD